MLAINDNGATRHLRQMRRRLQRYKLSRYPLGYIVALVMTIATIGPSVIKLLELRFA